MREMREHELIRLLRTGGPLMWDRPTPPSLAIDEITGVVPGSALRNGPLTTLREALTRQRVQLPPLVLAGGALACGGIGLAAGVVVRGEAVRPAEPVTTRVALQPFGEGPGDARAVVNVTTDGGSPVAQMQATGLPELPPGRHYEVWAIADDGQMVSLGRLPVGPGGAGGGEMPVPVALDHFRTLDVAVQPDGGPHVHSGHSVLRSGPS